ncbi:MAG TPA: methanol dehydrogenase [Sphingobacteriaceae bacterium]|nr:methanol dehydrogenase [Sphingobacteriaceae bacterium]
MIIFSSSAQTFPEKPSTLVNDYTNTLSADQVSQLEHKLVAFDDSTSTQIAVVIIKSLDGNDIADYASRLGEKWGVGRDKKNNGVMLLVALDDHKVTIQTGYGVEGALPDAIARRIIENEITPGFKNGDYYAGLDKGTDAIISYTKGEYKNEEPKQRGGKKGIPFGLIFLIIVVIIISISRRGGGGSSVIGSGGASPLWWMLMGSAMGGRGGRDDGGGFGGFSGGGGGGGFGGFGGGSFGGGGASGSW